MEATEAQHPLTVEDAHRYFPRPIARVQTSLLYRTGLLLVLLALIVLQASYAAMVALAMYGAYLYLLAIPDILSTLHVNQLTLILVVAPLVTAVIVTFFL